MERTKSHPLSLDGRDASQLRGDPITGERYYSKTFAQQEWDHLWKKIWHVAGRTCELQEPGDYLVHDFMHESVIVVRQDDGTLRAFYNSCGHRGQRLAWENSHAVSGFHCPYHGWLWGRDGVLRQAQDTHDFPQGNPCGTLSLKELRCDTWGGMIWYTMSDSALPLREFLEPIPEVFGNYPMEQAVRVFWMKINLNTNWKFATDNFSESYHTRTAHPQVPPWIDQDVDSARHEMYPRGHGTTVQPMRPSLSDRLPDGVPHPFDAILREWNIDPEDYPDYETKALQGWIDLKAAKRELWKVRGYEHYKHLNDEQLTDSFHTVIFPNVTLSFLPDHLLFYRTEPHPDDPGKCTFELWCMAYPVAGMTEVESIMAGRQPLREAELIMRDFNNGEGVPELLDQIVYQDMLLADGQQRGLRSQGYQDAYLTGQETRVRFFHEILNDYLEDRC